MENLTYRPATAADALQIAMLHAENWRQTYRGILRDDFLDGPVFDDRRNLWMQRLSEPPDNQWVCAAFDAAANLCGFVCVYGADDDRWGALIDNLHVRQDQRGSGIGVRLMREAADWVENFYPGSGIYLWVFEANHAARRFYERLGAANAGQEWHESPGGGGMALRYVWGKAAEDF